MINFLLLFYVTVQSNLQNATHFVGVAYPPNKISKTVLKMLCILHLFYEILLGSEQLSFYYKMLYITNSNEINIK